MDSANKHLSLIDNISVWKRGDQRAPHKPLLILLALARWKQSGVNHFPYADAGPELRRLLEDFGPPRKVVHPEYPFWRLRNDGIWTLGSTNGTLNHHQGDVSDRYLNDSGAFGQFDTDFLKGLADNPSLLNEVVQRILESHFPESIRADLLQAVGLEYVYPTSTKTVRTRDPQFRYDVLDAYEQKCAVCRFDVRLAGTLIGIEAAHIKWFQAGGPDTTDNGLALCSIHHKLLDRGAFTIDSAGLIQVSQKTSGSSGLSEWLTNFHGTAICEPVSTTFRPRPEFLDWHKREVFKGPSRD